MIWRKEQFLGSGRFLPWGCGCSIALCLHLSLLPTRDSVSIFGKGKRVVGANYKKFIRLPRSARFAFMIGLSAHSATDTEIRALLVSVRLSTEPRSFDLAMRQAMPITNINKHVSSRTSLLQDSWRSSSLMERPNDPR